ncbi:kinetochore protein NDC80 homolog isoform X2 [Nothobranchius furzeri]|uniref:kinetochore protein NDC80 homolog isoform X2 n=1 Tax=Nothobranchius furzeri TaxID=105023 RepID=UPI0039047201
MERVRMGRTSSRASEQRSLDSNRMSTVYATPRSQPSFGKLSLAKPSSVSSERRTSFFGARTSGASMHRNSTMSGFGGTEKIKDSRPLHDKSYVQQCIKQLHEFLVEQGFPGTLSSKTLQSPSTKEFVKMFEFIYCQLDPTFVMPNSKVEEEVPALLKALGYPFVLSKCSMYSVGAPHTWPQALGALMWLIDSVKINLSFGETYSKYMQGQDTFDSEDDVFLTNMKRLYNVDEALLVKMEEKNQILTEELRHLEKESQTDRLMTKRMEKMKLQTDLKKLQSYRSSIESFKASLENKASELNNELETSVGHLDSLKHQREELEQVLQNQKFTPADVERINREKRELEQTVANLTKALEDAEQHTWNEEIALSKVKGKVESNLAEYHKLARKLKLIPQTAENACGHDFELKPFEGGCRQRTQIEMLLKKMISNVEEESSRLTNSRLSLVESMEQLNSNVMDKLNDVKLLKEQIRKLDEQLELDMQELAREEQEWGAEIENIENHRKLLEEKVKFGYDEAVQQLKAIQQQYQLVLQETSEERRTVANNLMSVFTAVTNHLAVTELSLADLHSGVHRICKKTVEENEAALQKLYEMLKSFKAKANV